MFLHLGVIGLLALLCFLAALAGSVLWLGGWRWRWLAHVAVVLALVACGAAELSVWRAWRAPIDDRMEQAAEHERLQQVHTQVTQQVRRGRMFAEDSVEDALDVAGMDQRQAQRVQQQVGEARQYAYRSRGVQERDVPVSGDALQAVLDIHAATGEGSEYDVPRGAMTWDQKQRAIDRTTTLRNATWVIMLLALAVGSMDYFGRLGRPLAPLWPLPLDGRWVFRLWARPMRVQWQAQEQQSLEGLLGDLVRRGQSFCLFTASDPLAGQQALPRLLLGPLRFGELPCIHLNGDDAGDDVGLAGDDLLESLWFGRCACVVSDPQAQQTLLEQWQRFLGHRERTRAWAARTVHIIWDLPGPMPDAALASLAHLGPRANVSLMEVAAQTPTIEC